MVRDKGLTHVEAREVLKDRVFAVTSSRVPPGLVSALDVQPDVSGVIYLGPHAVSTSREMALAGSNVYHAVDLAAYEHYQASSSAPLSAVGGDDALVPWSLAGFVNDALIWGANLVFTPSGLIRVGDSAALAAVIDVSNDVRLLEVVTTAAIPQDWLTERYRGQLRRELKRSSHPVALVVVGQLDPFEDREVAEGLLEVLDTCQDQIFLHRTDMTAIEVVARPGLGASIGVTASLRHTVPPGRRAQTRRRKPRPKRSLHVFVPGISEFREVTELEGWFGDDAPTCVLPGCCGRSLTDFTQDPDDVGVLAVHNAKGWLQVASGLIACPPRYRGDWLHRHHLEAATAYDELRAMTGVRTIKPYGSARVWPSFDN